jgi:Mg2+ and Co2+ transporter CorA
MNQVNILDLFRKGYSIANAASWKDRQNKINSLSVIVSIVVAVASLFGYNIQIDPSQLTLILGWIVGAYGMFNMVITTVTSTKAGILPQKK